MMLTQPRLYDWQYQPLDAADAEALARPPWPPMRNPITYYDDFALKKKKIVDAVDARTTCRTDAAPPWLAPLETPSRSILVAAYRGRPYVDHGQNPGLMFRWE